MATKKTTKRISSAKTFLNTAQVASHFGFEIENKVSVDSKSVKLGKEIIKDPKTLDEYLPPVEEIIQIVQDFREQQRTGKNVIFRYFDQMATGSYDKQRKRAGEEQVSLHILGVEKSLAEAVLIKTIAVMLEESGVKKFTLHINNIGDKIAQTQYTREAKAFFRKHINLLNPTCQQFFKTSVHDLIVKGGDQCRVLKEHGPEPMDFLDEATRTRFSTLLEYVESFDIPYEIDHDLLGDATYSSHTQFRFIDDKTGKVVAAGSRYNMFSKKLGSRKDFYAIGANIWLKKSKRVSSKSVQKIIDSDMFLLQLGQEAKISTLQVLDSLWKERIHIRHSLNRDMASSQIQLATQLKSKKIIIIGHKEAMENSVMVKDADGKSQKIMASSKLADYLKTL